MSTFRDRVSDAISAHPDTVVLSFACVTLFLVTANFLWSRRARRLEKAVEELTASRDSLAQRLQRPEPASAEPDRAGPASARYSIAERPPRSQRVAVVGAAPQTPPETQPVSPATTAAPKAAEPERVEETIAAVEGDTTVRLATAAIPATWRAVDADVTPAAAAWAAAPPLPPPARTRGTPTPPKVAYDAWGSLNSAPAGAAWMAADLANDPAYAAWGDVLSGNSNGNGHDNGADGKDVELSELTTVATQREAVPDAEVDAPTPATEVEAPTTAGGSGGILLVEDDDNVAKIYRIVLESKGHTVRHASDGVAALEEVRKGRPDLVLLDVMMPRMNGILFLQSLRAQTDMRDVPVVILSNFRERHLVDRAMSLGAIEYIVKAQTRPDALLNALPRWLAGEPAFAE